MIYLSNNNCVLQLSGQHYYCGIDRQGNGEVYMVSKKSCWPFMWFTVCSYPGPFPKKYPAH
jgi:hypothetical protein